MGPIPLVNIMAVVHLCFVAAFLGMYLCEAVVEAYGAQKAELHPSAIRNHYLIDIFVELPVMFGVLVTGIVLVFLVAELTVWHFVLIVAGTIAALFCPFCFFRYVRTRNRLLEQWSASEAECDELRKRMGVATLALFNPLLLAALIIGFWLAYHRVVESIYS